MAATPAALVLSSDLKLPMHISNFHDLLMAARQQPVPQRLLFVFAAVELPENATPQQQADFEAGQGGAIAPLMCVDKDPHELDAFATLMAESRQFEKAWAMVFVAALSSTSGNAPDADEVQTALRNMVESVKAGDIDRFIPFNTQGEPLQMGS
jgi:hypothetical protein